MKDKLQFIVGTSGYSFKDWVGTFYPPDTRQPDMFRQYVKHFKTAEINFTYYRLPDPRTIGAIAAKSPDDFTFWVKANRATTHERDRSVAGRFIEGIEPMQAAGKLAGVLLQFPQSFHRTAENRRYLADVIEDFAPVPLAVEFRQNSWQHESTLDGLRERGVTLVIPDVPDIAGLFHHPAAATTRTGYLRLHSRDGGKWYAGGGQRYDYNYSQQQMEALIADWNELAGGVDRVYAFFNNCHGGQAAHNAEAFAGILEQL